MIASDIMTSHVIAVGPDTAVRHIAGLLFRHRISAVPVLETGQLVGIVSEGDLLHRHEIGTERSPRGPAWLRLFNVDRPIADYVKSHATRARDIMTRDVVCVTPGTPVAQIAALLEKRGVKRVPVLEHGRLAGIVSRSDLVRALAAQGRLLNTGDSSDRAIQARLCAELERQPWWPILSQVSVTDGVVHYYGMVDSEAQRQAARVAAESVPGVRRVEDRRVLSTVLAWSV